jgi:hypothetical protein
VATGNSTKSSFSPAGGKRKTVGWKDVEAASDSKFTTYLLAKRTRTQ